MINNIWQLMLLAGTLILTFVAVMTVVALVINIITKIYSTTRSFLAARKYDKEVFELAVKYYLEQKGDEDEEENK